MVYPYQEQPEFLVKHDERTAELRRVRQLLDRLGDLAGLPKSPEVTALMEEITEFLRQRRGNRNAGEDEVDGEASRPCPAPDGLACARMPPSRHPLAMSCRLD